MATSAPPCGCTDPKHRTTTARLNGRPLFQCRNCGGLTTNPKEDENGQDGASRSPR